MEDAEHWVYECSVEVKSDTDDHNDEYSSFHHEANTLSEIKTEPSTSDTVHSDISILPFDSPTNKTTEIIDISSNEEYEEEQKSSVPSEQIELNSADQKLLEGIHILEAQRAQSIKDLDELYELQELALSDPTAFVKKLKDHNVNFSTSSNVRELPEIDWSRYEMNFNAYRIKRQQTKLAAKINDLVKKGDELRKIEEASKLRDQNRPKQRYKVWTPEEQKKLEELLVQFPDEPIEARRWEKIAAFFEDRTPGQVCGRVKKYFKTLKKHGIPIRNGVPDPDLVKNPCSCILCPTPNSHLISRLPPVFQSDGSGGTSNFLLEQKKKFLRYSSCQFWTEKEQKKLDELLVKYPPEEHESSRYEKIAKHFGNRTPRQVATRVNYLKRMMQHGRFVPGKIPGIQLNQVYNEDFPRFSTGSNFMQYWTPEEQRKLEELLIRFPPEMHELQRCKKIAACLENRTPMQVCGRVRNYFILCKRYGIPVLGKIPKHTRRKFGRKRTCRIICESSTNLNSSTSGNSTESVEQEANQGPNLMEKKYEEKQESGELPYFIYEREHSNIQESNPMETSYEEYEDSSGFSHTGYKTAQEFNDELNMMENAYEENQDSSESSHFDYRVAQEINHELNMMGDTFEENQDSSESSYFGFKPEQEINEGISLMEKGSEEKQDSYKVALTGFKPGQETNQEINVIDKGSEEKQDCDGLAHTGYKDINNMLELEIKQELEMVEEACTYKQNSSDPVHTGYKPKEEIKQQLELEEKACTEKQNSCGLVHTVDKPKPEIMLVEEACTEKQTSSGLFPTGYNPEQELKQGHVLVEEASTEKQNSSGLVRTSYNPEQQIKQAFNQVEESFTENQNSSGAVHIGYKCYRCKVEPIMGIRWHCTVCITQSVNFCTACCTRKCMDLYEHSFDHPLEAIQGVIH